MDSCDKIEVSNERVMVCALVKPSYVDNLSGLHIFLDHLKTVSMTNRVTPLKTVYLVFQREWSISCCERILLEPSSSLNRERFVIVLKTTLETFVMDAAVVQVSKPDVITRHEDLSF